MLIQSLTILAALSVAFVSADKKCEVCVNFLTKFYDHIGRDGSDMVKTESALMKYCRKATGKDESFCYYIGGLETSATRIIVSVTKPLSYGKPVEKICRDLGKMDSEICELEYGNDLTY